VTVAFEYFKNIQGKKGRLHGGKIKGHVPPRQSDEGGLDTGKISGSGENGRGGSESPLASKS